MLGEATAKLGVRTIVVGPDRWGDEHYKPYKKKNFIFKTLPIAGAPSLYTFSFKALNRIISGYRPCVIYCMEEIFTFFARECIRYGTEYRCPVIFFTWENRPDYRMGDSFDRIEQNCIREANKIICGNKLAKKRMINCGADKGKLHILLQSGIDTELFKPNEEITKEYDVIYHGRLVREKGVYYLENACRSLGVHLLTVGGRGKYHFKYGESKDWVDYEDLPSIINSAHIGVDLSRPFRRYL